MCERESCDSESAQTRGDSYQSGIPSREIHLEDRRGVGLWVSRIRSPLDDQVATDRLEGNGGPDHANFSEENVRCGQRCVAT